MVSTCCLLYHCGDPGVTILLSLSILIIFKLHNVDILESNAATVLNIKIDPAVSLHDHQVEPQVGQHVQQQVAQVQQVQQIRQEQRSQHQQGQPSFQV